MEKEVKISLPFYKVAYAVFFIVILSLIRGVTSSYEIGIALEAPMAILAAVFCADTYVQEMISKRSEVQRLYSMKKRIRSIGRRMVIQELFLLLLAVIGYVLFFIFQKPQLYSAMQPGGESEIKQFLVCLAAMVVTLAFWGILSNTISCIFRNMWVGIGGTLILWLVTNSSFGDRCFGSWNLFSYTFRAVENSSDLSWIRGKAICLIFCIIMIVLLPKILKKRG